MEREFLRRALELAARGRWTAAPNPMVGVVIVRDGAVVGEGWHARAGGPHAEVMALRMAGERARGATIYLNLEPCSHHGRTPPCTEALLAAGVARVVASHLDPDPRVRGRGFATLRQHGVEVEHGRLRHDAVRLNLRFLIPPLLGRPGVTLKWAMSLDGRVATASGESQWITSRPAREWALDLREEHDAIVVGSGTVLADDPRLTRRRGKASGRIWRIALDRRLRITPQVRLFEEEGPVLIYTEAAAGDIGAALEDAGAEVVRQEAVTPASVLADLKERGVGSVLVEGGPTVAGAFVESSLYDRVVAVAAPLLIGGSEAPGALATGVSALAEAPRLAGLEIARRGDDVILEGLRAECLPELLQRLDTS